MNTDTSEDRRYHSTTHKADNTTCCRSKSSSIPSSKSRLPALGRVVALLPLLCLAADCARVCIGGGFTLRAADGMAALAEGTGGFAGEARRSRRS